MKLSTTSYALALITLASIIGSSRTIIVAGFTALATWSISLDYRKSRR